MRQFSIQVDIAAPPSAVLAVMMDVERWHEWTSTIRSIRLLDGSPLHVGSRALIRQPKLLPAKWRVVAIEPGRGFTWITRNPGSTITANHFVDPIPAGSRATLSLNFDGLFGGVIARLTRKINEEYLQIEAAGLKQRSEAAPLA